MANDQLLIKQLAQKRPSTTNATVAIYKPKKRKLVIKTIHVTNTTGNALAYYIYLDKDGSTYDASTALYNGVTLAANTTVMHEFANGLPFDPDAAGNLAVKSSEANAINFTIDGIEA